MMATFSPIQRLPNEIMLECAAHLGPSDLKQLALVSKRLKDVAQDALYRDIVIPVERTAHLLRTLLHRPHLAGKAQTLVFSRHGTPGMVQRCYLDNVAMEILRWPGEKVFASFFGFPDNLSYSSAPAYATCLLKVLRHLTTLAVSPSLLELEPMIRFISQFPYGFADLLSQLRSLEIRLEDIRIIQYCPRMEALSLWDVDLFRLSNDLTAPTESLRDGSLLKSLKLHLKFRPQWKENLEEWVNALSTLPSRLKDPNLETLDLKISVDTRGDGDEFPVIDYDLLFPMIHAVWPRVFTLEIQDIDGDARFICTEPVPAFENLKRMVLPFGSLIDPGNRWPMDFRLQEWLDHGFTPISTTLPKTLQTFSVSSYTKNILPWLKCFPLWFKHYPDLRLVEATGMHAFSGCYNAFGEWVRCSEESRLNVSASVQAELGPLQEMFKKDGVVLAVNLSVERPPRRY